MRRAFLILLAVLLATACAGKRADAGARAGELSGAAAPAEAREVLAEFMEALNTCDLDRTMALFAPDATMFFPLSDSALRAESREEIASVFGSFYDQVRAGKAGPRYMNLVPQDVKIQSFGGGAAVSFQIVSGPVTSRRSIVLRKDDGRWVIVHFHASNVRED